MPTPYQKIISALLLLSLTASMFSLPLLAQAQSTGALVGTGLNTVLGGGKCGGLTARIGSLIGGLGKEAVKALHLESIGKSIVSHLGLGGLGKVGGVVGGVAKGFLGGGGSVPVEIKGDVKENIAEQTKKQCVINPLVKIITSALIRSLTSSIVGWIQADNGRNVGFVGNFEKTLKHELNVQSGEFINQLAGINLCGNVRPFLRIALSTPRGLRPSLGCSVTKIVRNVDDFFNDFQKGGWDAFLKVSLDPQNNPYGAYLIALNAQVQAQDERRRSLAAGYQAGAGFLGFRVDEKVCTPVDPEEMSYNIAHLPADKHISDIGYEFDEETQQWVTCETQSVTKTPGQTVASLLNKTIGAGFDQAFSATELDQAFGSIINALINRLLSSSGGALKNGVFTSREGIFEPTLKTVQNDQLDQEIKGHEQEGSGGGQTGGGSGGGEGGTGGGTGGEGTGGGTGGGGGGTIFVSDQQRVEIVLRVLDEVLRIQNAVATLDQNYTNTFNTAIDQTKAILTDNQTLNNLAKQDQTSPAVQRQIQDATSDLTQIKTSLKASLDSLGKIQASKGGFTDDTLSLLGLSTMTKLLRPLDQASFGVITQNLDAKSHLITAALVNKGLTTDYPGRADLPTDNFINMVKGEIQGTYQVTGRVNDFKDTEFPNNIAPLLPDDKRASTTALVTALQPLVLSQVDEIQSLTDFLLKGSPDLAAGNFPPVGAYAGEVESVVEDLISQERQADTSTVQILKSIAGL